MATHEECKVALETLLDREGLRYVLDTLSEICEEKREHVLTVWNDKGLARAWRENAKACERAMQAAVSL